MVMSQYSEVSTIVSSNEATWSFTIATTSETTRMMPCYSSLTAEKCQKANMHSNSFCRSLSNWQSNKDVCSSHKLEHN